MGMGFVCCLISWFLITKYGRRPIYNIGLAVLTVIMFLIAFLDFAPDYDNRPGVIWAQSSLLVSGDHLKEPHPRLTFDIDADHLERCF